MKKLLCTRSEMGFTYGGTYEIVLEDDFNGIVVENDFGHQCCMAPSYVSEIFEVNEDG